MKELEVYAFGVYFLVKYDKLDLKEAIHECFDFLPYLNQDGIAVLEDAVNEDRFSAWSAKRQWLNNLQCEVDHLDYKTPGYLYPDGAYIEFNIAGGDFLLTVENHSEFYTTLNKAESELWHRWSIDND